MTQLFECDVIMLPTKADSHIVQIQAVAVPSRNILSYYRVALNGNRENGNFAIVPQHLYVLDNGKGGGKRIKPNDWFIFFSMDGPQLHQYHSDDGFGIKTMTKFNEVDGSSIIVDASKCSGKIVASTDKKLSLPKIAVSFINGPYIQSNGNIGKVKLEMQMGLVEGHGGDFPSSCLKLTADNEIIISSWLKSSIEMKIKAKSMPHPQIESESGSGSGSVIFAEWAAKNGWQYSVSEMK